MAISDIDLASNFGVENSSPFEIYMCDLTHNSHKHVASNFMPLGIGLICSYLKLQIPNVKIDLFKYPHDLEQALSVRVPQILAFSNYSWNLEISYAFASAIKKVHPEVVIVFGGPNYDFEKENINKFWLEHEDIDFYIVKEGEKAFANLVSELASASFNVEKVKKYGPKLFNCHFRSSSNIFEGPQIERFQSLDEIPSPYLDGIMDKFFDGILIPLVHTTRGCPFTCKFCTEGAKYYNKVAQRSSLKDELIYIAKRIGTINDLFLSDANFGMYAQDLEKAKVISEIRKEFGWPKKLIVSTGKNQKERVIKVAGELDGTLSVAASLQSTDPEVLNNVNRSNISLDALKEMVAGANETEATTFTEIILNLPGDSLEKHKKSLRDVVGAGLGVVRMYQFLLLPQTELYSSSARREYGFVTRFRINPRSIGSYLVNGKRMTIAEADEIVVASNTMSLEEYLQCRMLDLSVEILHNTGFFREISNVLRYYNLEFFDLIEIVHQRILNSKSGLSDIYQEFLVSNLSNTYESKSAFKKEVEAKVALVEDELEDTNELARAKARAVSECLDLLYDLVYTVAKEMLGKFGFLNNALDSLLSELKEKSQKIKSNIMVLVDCLFFTSRISFQEVLRSDWAGNLIDYEFAPNINYKISHSDDQKASIEGWDKQYDLQSLEGRSRLLMRVNPVTLFPKVDPVKNLN